MCTCNFFIFFKNVTCDMWHLTRDTWHMTHDTWHPSPPPTHTHPTPNLGGCEEDLSKKTAPDGTDRHTNILTDMATLWLTRPRGPSQSWSRYVRLSVCLSVCLSVPSGAVFFGEVFFTSPQIWGGVCVWGGLGGCHVSRVTCHMSRVTCHLSRVTCHMSHIFLFFI